MSAALQTQQSQEDIGVAPAERHRLQRGSVLRWTISLAILVVLLVLWQVFADHLIKPIWISSPRLVWNQFIAGAQNGSLATNTLATAEEALFGLVLGTVGGVIAGIFLARAVSVGKVLDPYILGAYSLPRVALAPFFVLWLGIGIESKVFLVVSIVFFVVLFNVKQGMQSIDLELVDAMRSMHASRIEMLRYVTIPSVLPWIVSSVKICIGMALIGAVVGELVGASKGLGWAMTNSINNFDTSGAVLDLIVMALLAMIFYYVIAIIEARLFRWRRTDTSSTVPM